MELVAMQLKAEGRLLSRSLSFEGCKFNLVPLVNSKFQVSHHDTVFLKRSSSSNNSMSSTAALALFLRDG